KGILVFPTVKKAGFMVGGQRGEGALRVGGKTAGYYKTTAASFGLQAGGQKFSYAMFFMTDGALEYLKNSKGWEVGEHRVAELLAACLESSYAMFFMTDGALEYLKNI